MSHVIWYYDNPDGSPMTREEIIDDQVTHLSCLFIEKHNGARPSKELIEQWVDRLERAYDRLEITKVIT